MKKKQFYCSVVILAAGHSKRMNFPKLALQFKNGITFLENIIENYYNFGCENIVVVLNKEGVAIIEKFKNKYLDKVIFILNEQIELGRFHSIQMGMKNLSNKYPVFIHNIDNPFVNHKVLLKLISHSYSDYTTPSFNGKGGHPILISEKVRQQIISEEKNNLILSEFLKRFNKLKIEVDDRNVLVNINTKEEYQTFKNKL